ncbi:MAG: penicillin acylase family protein [Ferruginibacter sp.]
MKQFFFILFLLPSGCSDPPADSQIKKYAEQSSRVTIIRDCWGIPHVYGKSDADAVFGLMYAQCEESFERVERNYIIKFGRLAETEGPARLYEDLTMKLFYDSGAAIADYNRSPAWLVKLLNAFADGVNYYLYKHPETIPRLLKHFEPWFPLMMTDGAFVATQAGGLYMKDVLNLYGNREADGASFIPAKENNDANLAGSNGFAIGPSKTTSKNAMLYINPHVSFDFRMEAQMVSEEGLNAYGAVTWGQFFVYQGFNEHCGWMHTSSLADAADLYEEKIVKKDSGLFYEYNDQLRPVTSRQLVLKYEKDGMHTRAFTTWYTHHGPVIGSRNNKWLSVKEQNRTLNGLIQSWQRTKARDYTAFKETMELRSNNSTNTIFADDKGNIGYWHGNFIPRRDTTYDWTQPVPGNTSATEWKGIHAVDETVHYHNPPGGWIQNCNSTPFNAAGINSLLRNAYPYYMAPEGENFRSQQAINELSTKNNFTIDSLVALGTSRYLAAFDSLLPPLLKDFDSLPVTAAAYSLLREPVAILKAWDKRSAVSSVATTLAVLWGRTLLSENVQPVNNKTWSSQVDHYSSLVIQIPAARRLEMLSEIITGLRRLYGDWKVPWGDINRFQRISGSVFPQFDDSRPSLPVGMASSLFGSLPAYETAWGDNKKGYGVSGNSFVAVVEFGKRIRAKSIVAGGQSFVWGSKHFADQAPLFVEGKFKEVLFYKEDLLKQKESMYHPGE